MDKTTSTKPCTRGRAVGAKATSQSSSRMQQRVSIDGVKGKGKQQAPSAPLNQTFIAFFEGLELQSLRPEAKTTVTDR